MKFAEFSTRQQAGRLIGLKLKALKIEEPVVLAISLGAVPIAAESARLLACPLGLIISRKVVHPKHPEMVIGVATEEDFFSIRPQTDTRLDLNSTELEHLLVAEANKLQLETEFFKNELPPLLIEERNVILIDEIAMSGATARAAIQTARLRGARKVSLALPICPAKTARLLRKESSPDFLIILHEFERKTKDALGWQPVPNSEVMDILKKAKRRNQQPSQKTIAA